MKLARLVITVLLGTALSLGALGSAHAASPKTQIALTSPILLDSAAQSAAATATVRGRGPLTGSPMQTGLVIVRTKSSATPGLLADVAKRADTSANGVRHLRGNRMEWAVPVGRSANEFASELVASGKVEYAIPDYTRQLTAYTPPAYVAPDSWSNPNADPFLLDSRTWTYPFYSESYPYGESWWLRDINAMSAWQQAYTGPNIVGKYPLRADGSAKTVYVLDSGLYLNHEDVGANISGGWDYTDHQDSNYPFDWVGDSNVTPIDITKLPITDATPLDYWQTELAHGTCVAGEIAATANNRAGSVGVGYDTKVIVDKIMGQDLYGNVVIDDYMAATAIIDAADAGASVINMSWGGYPDSADLRDAVQYAHSKGVVVVAAKGNDASGQAFYPSSYPGVVSVGALDKNMKSQTIPASFSNYYHTSRDIMAPGSFVWGLFIPNKQITITINGAKFVSDAPPGYSVWDGTSMATPVVAGAIAWLWRAAPALSGDEITDIVLNSATRHPATKHYPYGWREIDLNAAYAMLKAQYPLLVNPTVVSEKTAPLSGSVRAFWNLPESPLRGVAFTPTLDGIAQAATTASQEDFALSPGTHTLSVQADSDYNWDDGTAVGSGVINVVAAALGTSTISAHVAGLTSLLAAPNYAENAAIDADLGDASGTPLAGAVVTLQSSSDAVHFSAVDGAVVSNVGPGVYRTSVAPSARTYYRFVFAGTGGVGGSTSNAVTVIPHLYVSTPSSKSSISHKKKLAVSGVVKPARTSASRAVQLQLYRWNGRRYAAYSRAWARARNRGGYSSYSASLKLRAGSYRIYAFAPGDSLHLSATSGYRSVKVN